MDKTATYKELPLGISVLTLKQNKLPEITIHLFNSYLSGIFLFTVDIAANTINKNLYI